MPEVTPVWIDGYYESQAEAASDMKVWLQAHGIKLEGVPTPALTLDQIEAWLTAEPLFDIHVLLSVNSCPRMQCF